MATLGKIKSIDEYKKELGTPNVDAANKNIEQKRAADENTIIDYNSTIDDAAQATTNRYQQSIADAPKLFEDQYDANHINELVAKKKIEERMANLGLAGSGLNRSQQTALAVQRGNADAATQRQQQDYVTAAQQAIDQVLAQAEADKATHANQLRGNTDTWAADLLARMAQADNENAVNAYNTGVEGVYSQYKTDTEKETAAAKLLHEAEQNALDREAENLRSLRSLGLTLDADNHIVPLPMSAYDQARIDSDNYWKNLNYQLDVDKHNLNVEKLNQSAVTDLTSDVATYAKYRMANDDTLTFDDAMLEGRLAYGVADDTDKIIYQGKSLGYTGDALNAYVNAGGGDAGTTSAAEVMTSKAQSVIEPITFKVSGKIWNPNSTFWKSQSGGDGELVAGKVKEKLEKNQTYKSMSEIEKRITASYAIVKSVEESFPNESQESNLNRIKKACEEYSEADYTTAYSYFVGEQEEPGQPQKTQANASDRTSPNRLSTSTSPNFLTIPESAQKLMG